ncbi:MAG: Asp-tRNA(Asn)/Glu-tRNA(Gln) amidotransferase subunit GatB [bacterium]|nr:Asp-tRNA(Asn)/Glu-tRNA(Gln) amidotransferase subunit GatB [bacterium]
MDYKLTVGMEVHAELATETKMFCRCQNDPDALKPNTRVCPVCMGHPGALPVPNKKAIESVIKVGLALGCDIAERSKFDRKNYFYPDLPKGYQISQYDEPLCRNGQLALPTTNDQRPTTIRIHRIHLEEDTGKLIHPDNADYSLVDYNRAGVPLMELVTEPDIHDAKDAARFCQELQLVFRYLGVSDADMEKGHMRCEANISVSPATANQLGTKVEVKNLNSFKAVEGAIMYEYKRQIEAIEAGEKIVQETRGWDDVKGQTYSQRSKEEAHDYRYFPEPDIPPLNIEAEKRGQPSAIAYGVGRYLRGKTRIEEALSVEKLKAQLPELPAKRRERFGREFGIGADQIEIFTLDKPTGNYFENVASELALAHDAGEYKDREDAARGDDDVKTHAKAIYKLAANYLINDLARAVTDAGVAFDPERLTPENFAEFVLRIEKGIISSAAAKVVLAEMVKTGADPDEVIREKNLAQVSDSGELEAVVSKIVAANASIAQDFKDGKQNALQFLVGQVMKETKGRANPKVAQDLLRKNLSA